MFGLTILGNNAAIPAFGRHPTAQALTHENQVYLVDCGEGTQQRLMHYRVRHNKINHIFISHLHGDHYYGLIGLITTMGFLGREHKLCIYAPPMLKSIIDIQLAAAETTLPFPLEFFPITAEGVLLNSSKMEVSCVAVHHRIACWGFIFKEKKLPRKILPERAIEAGIPPAFFPKLALGFDYVNAMGKTVLNEDVTLPAPPGRMYAYSADTIFEESLADKFKNANLLYHEATYLNDLQDRAGERFHCTALQAATIAGKSGAKKLLLGHFSSKYEDLQPFLAEAGSIFEPVELALEGVTYLVR